MPRSLDNWTPVHPAADTPQIGLRWHITRSGDLLAGWPPPGLESSILSMGWLTDDALLGFIEHPSSPVDIGVLEILEERFPGRRWFAGSFSEPEPAVRRAA